MRRIFVLLIFTVTTGVVSWNTFGSLLDEKCVIEETLSEETEFENQDEEKEAEDFQEPFSELFNFPEKNSLGLAMSTPTINYCFTISTYCLEPEVNPPRC